MQKIILASNNQGKIKDFNHLIGNKFSLITQSEFAITEAVENGLSFVENALIKARNASSQSGFAAIADDSGIVVDYLKGDPGIYSARYAGKDNNALKNNKKLLKQLQDVPYEKRGAKFWCTLVFIEHEKDPTPIIAEGVWQGFIATQISGDNGFGYDPIFYVPSCCCTVAELDIATKNTLSHRAQALTKLVKKICP